MYPVCTLHMAQSGGADASQMPDLLANFRANQPSSRQSPSSTTQSFPFAAPAAPVSSPQTHSTLPNQVSAMSPGISSAFNDTHNATARTPAPAGSQLLNLLKFGSSPQASPSLAQASRPAYTSPSAHSVHGRGISASDLYGSMSSHNNFSNSHSVSSFTGGKSSTPTPRERTQATSSATHQDALLRLLNQTTARSDNMHHKYSESAERTSQPIEDREASHGEDKHASVTSVKNVASSRHESPIRLFGSNEESTPTPFEPAVSPQADASQKNGSIFTYVNPFEQLAASSPRNLKPKTPTNGDKRRIKSPSPGATHISSRRKLTPSSGEVLQSIESPPSHKAKNERSQIEALMGIGAPSRDAETVAEALNEVSGRVDQQVGNALAKAEEKSVVKEQESYIKQEEPALQEQQVLKDVELRAQEVAADVKKELDKDENQDLLKESMATPMAEAVKDLIDEAASGKVADEWESADGEELVTKDDTSHIVQVHQFPMRPFVCISLVQKGAPKLKFREDAILHVARFKKDFDQLDRNLATATNEFIVYGMPKNGGIRIIQQDNGQNSSIFAKSQDRIFNVAISSAHSGSSMKGTQTIIATGVSGTVYWTTIAKPEEEVTQEHMEKQGLIIPPLSAQSDSTSGGQLKTRAKKSNRHPEFFAIGRGKSIQIIFTAHAQSSDLVTKEGLMDTDKYFAERNLKVTTGKAGKDFTFSEDDSTIVSLDKAGKLRFWDIRDLTNEANEAISLMIPIEVKTPTLTLSTAHSSEKSWPTSVLFVDKLRPYTKGTALRYIVVGMKQNHTLQLWDLCLGKAVQELSFPHGSETDPICSVTYHPASGVIAVGHSSRNSIYFIHLSAPKYNLPAMSQAKFVQRLANKDSTLPKAEATAIMSGMREYSFGEKGQIRSVELVPSSSDPSRGAEDEDDPTLFELYIMHSKGVTCLGVKREDLGWSKDSRVLHPLDAEKEGSITIKELREVSAALSSELSAAPVNGDTQRPATPSKTKPSGKENAKSARSTADEAKSALGAVDKAEKKKNKRSGPVDTESGSQVAATPPTSEPHANAAQREPLPVPQAAAKTGKDPALPNTQKQIPLDASDGTAASANDRPVHPVANGESISLGISGDFLDRELKKIERGVSDEFNKVLNRELEALYRRFSEDKRVQDAAGAAKQDAMLRLVSSTLSDNVEKSLSRIIHQNIIDSVVPSIGNEISTILKANLSTAIAHQIDEKMAAILKHVLPDTIGRVMQSQQVLRPISEQVTKSITGHVEREFSTSLEKTIVPAFTNLAVTTAQKVSGDTERRVREQLQQAEFQRREDTIKIEQLTNLVRSLSETVHAMAAAQSDFQVEILKQQQEAAQSSRGQGRQHSLTPSESASMHVSPEQAEIDAVTIAMDSGRFEEATVMVSNLLNMMVDLAANISQWLQSQQQVELFDNFFVRCDPAFLQQTSPLVILSVGAALTSSLKTNVMERLAWLETVFHIIDTGVRWSKSQIFFTRS